MAVSPGSVRIIAACLCLLGGSHSLLSDYKICGDPACESLMSRVQALRDHHSDDCRFLSFRRGETVFVYHKLSGRRDDLWAGTINKRFGYFPKDLVQEEQAYAVMDKVVETRKEDFFCMDEFGYPIDSSHLDNDDEQIKSETDQSRTGHLKPASRDVDRVDKAGEKPEDTSRARLDVDLEGSQSNDEGKKVEEEEESRSSSWLDMGIRMLGLKEDAVGHEEEATRGIEEIEERKVETESQPQPELTEESKTEHVTTHRESSMAQTSGNHEKVEDFKGEDHQTLRAGSGDPQEGPSADRTGGGDGSESDLNPNNGQTTEQTDNDDKKPDLSGESGPEESSEHTPHIHDKYDSEVQNSAEENQDGGQSHGKDGLIQNETSEDIYDDGGIDTAPKTLDQEDVTKHVQNSSQESGVMERGSKVGEDQDHVHLREEEIRNLRETEEILEEKPPGKTELQNESEERKLEDLEFEGMEVQKKQKEVQKFNEKEKLATLSEEQTEEIKESKKKKTREKETMEIKEEKREMELENIQEKNSGVEGKQVYKDLGSPELGSVPQQEMILETLLVQDDEDKNQGKEMNPDEMKERETETENQTEMRICPNSSKAGPEEDGGKGTVKGSGPHSEETLSEEKDLPDRTDEMMRVHPGKEENTPSLKEGISGSPEGRGSLGESSRTPTDPSRDTSTRGPFGFLQNALGFFSQTSDTGTKVQPRVVTPSEAPLMEASGTPEKDLVSTINSSPNQLTDPELLPLSLETSLDETSHSPEELFQIQDLSKSYPNLLVRARLEDVSVILENIGPEKLRSLELVLSGLNGPDADLSAVLDMERLLQSHVETLLGPSVGGDGALSQDHEKTQTLIVLQTMEMLLKEIRRTLNLGPVDLQDHPALDNVERVDPSSSSSMNRIKGNEDFSRTDDHPEAQNDWMSLDKEQSGVAAVSDAQRASEEVNAGSAGGQGSPPLSEEVKHTTFSFFNQWSEGLATRTRNTLELPWIAEHVVSALPEDLRPGPDVFGMPWEPVIVTCVLGLLTILLFTCRCYSSIKSRTYRSKEQWMSEQIVQLLDEKCKVLETVSQCQREHDELQSSLEDGGAEAQTRRAEQLEVKAGDVENAKKELETDVFELQDLVEQQRDRRVEQEARIAALEQSMDTFQEEIKELQSQDEQAQTSLRVYSMNSERLHRNLDTAGGENALLQDTNTHLRQQAEGWAERVSELEAEIRRCELAHGAMMQDVTTKDQRITSLTDRLLKMKAWDSDVENEDAGGERSGGADAHLQKVQKLIYAAKLNADLKAVDEEKDRVFSRLDAEVKATEDLEDAIKDMESEKLRLQSEADNYTAEVQRLQQKLQIMTEMYQENELKLHRLLTVEEKERLHKEEKLHKADKNIALAMEELNNYRQRAGEMEEELDKTKQSYQTQISAHEKKAHNNWLAARAADRELTDIRRENALLRQKLTDTQFKLDALDKDPYALGSLAHPLPFRGERSPYGRPASETRGFLSPPTLMDAPPPRLSPRVPRGPGEPSGGQSDQSGPHSDSGSSSPTWDKDRRGPPLGPLPGPPGYMFTDPGAPMFRRPPPPGRGFPPAPPHPGALPDESYRESVCVRAAEENAPEAEPRMGGAPPMAPIDAPFPRRAAYRPPPPPDFFPPRGPGGPPMIPAWALPPSGMMPPLRFPPPHMPPMRLPPPSMAPPPFQQSFPPPPHNQPPQDGTATAEDSI